MRRIWLSLTILACALPLAVVAQEQTKEATAAKITAEQVLEKYVEVTGGREAYNKITSSVAKGSLEIKAQGLTGTVMIYAKNPNKFLNVMTLQGVGEMKQGYDGKIGWAQDPFSGLRTLDGPELSEMKRQADFNSSLKWRELYKKIELVGTKKLDQGEAYVIRLTLKPEKPEAKEGDKPKKDDKAKPKENDKTITQYYDTKTFLLLRTEMVVESPQGTFPVEVVVSDYKEVDGVKVPFVSKQKVGPAEIVLTLTEIKNNEKIDDTLFNKPAK